ncbi:MAG: LEPR-XLL domain-containing protein [Verrucomicrobia bacterium]|nr:LEPR-XLL domain-containing protein [Verrucomicrobiota bacterium]
MLTRRDLHELEALEPRFLLSGEALGTACYLPETADRSGADTAEPTAAWEWSTVEPDQPSEGTALGLAGSSAEGWQFDCLAGVATEALPNETDTAADSGLNDVGRGPDSLAPPGATGDGGVEEREGLEQTTDRMPTVSESTGSIRSVRLAAVPSAPRHATGAAAVEVDSAAARLVEELHAANGPPALPESNPLETAAAVGAPALSVSGDASRRGIALHGGPVGMGPKLDTVTPATPTSATDLQVITLHLDRAVMAEGAREATTYTLSDLGPDRLPGGGDDVLVELSPVYTEGSREIELRIAEPLREGLYELTVRGDANSGLRGLDGTPLDQDQDGAPDPFVTLLTIDWTGPRVSGIGVGRVLAFDGANDFVRIPRGAAVGFGDAATVEVWFKTASSGADQLVLQNLAGTGISLYLNRFQVGSVLFLFDGDSGNDTRAFGTGLNDGRWHHAAAVFDRGTVTTYIDGRAAGTKTEALVQGVQADGYFGSGSGTQLFYQGELAEVRLWTVARTEAQIGSDLARALEGTEPDLARHWRLDAGLGTVVVDRVGSGEDGLLESPDPSTRPRWVAGNPPIERRSLFLTLVDSGGLDAASVTAVGHYSVLASGGDGTFSDGNELDATDSLQGVGFDPLTSVVRLEFDRALAEDFYQVRVRGAGGVRDLAGNQLGGGTDYASGPLEVLTRPALISLKLAEASDTGASSTDNLTRLNQPTFLVTVNDAGRIGIDFDGDGTLLAQGTAAAPIVFTSWRDDRAGVDLTGPGLDDGRPGDWETIHFRPGSGSSVLEWVEVRYAGNFYYPGHGERRPAIQVDGADLVLRDLLVRDVDSTGVYLTSGKPRLERVAVQRASGSAFYAEIAADPIHQQLSASQSGWNGYGLTGGEIAADRTWDFGGAVLRLNVRGVKVAQGATLTVVPGQVVKFNQELELVLEGNLRAVGTAAQPIVFTSWRDDTVGGDSNNNGAADAPDSSDWEAIYLNAGSDDSVLEQVQIRYAGNFYHPRHGEYRAALYFTNTRATAQQVRIQTVDHHGVWISGGAPTLDRVTVRGARGYAFSQDLGADPAWTSPVALDNWYDALYLRAGTLTQPIVFTSRRDDTALGDTFHDGATAPQSGDWRHLRFEATSKDSVLDRVDVRYAGNRYYHDHGNRDHAITINGSAPVLRNTRVRDANGLGVNIAAGAPRLEQVTVERSAWTAYYVDYAAAPVLVGLRAVDTGADVVGLYGSALAGDRTFDGGGLPMRLDSDLVVPAAVTLTIVPGQIFKLGNERLVQIDGTLTAKGTAERPIVFTSWRDDSAGGDSNNNGAGDEPLSGDWQSIVLNDGSDASVLEYVEVRYAGNRYYSGHGARRLSLQLSRSNATLRQVKVLSADGVAIGMYGGAPTLEQVTALGGGDWPFYQDVSARPQLRGLTATQNRYQGYILQGGSYTTDLRLPAHDFAYVTDGNLQVGSGATLTLEAGVVLKMAREQMLQVDGRLDVQGTAARPVVLTSREDDSVAGDALRDGWAIGSKRELRPARRTGVGHVDVAARVRESQRPLDRERATIDGDGFDAVGLELGDRVRR